jgi:hypothetical protein
MEAAITAAERPSMPATVAIAAVLSTSQACLMKEWVQIRRDLGISQNGEHMAL